MSIALVLSTMRVALRLSILLERTTRRVPCCNLTGTKRYRIASLPAGVGQQRVRGLPLVTNDTVNLCASLVGALTAYLMHHGDTSSRSCRRGAQVACAWTRDSDRVGRPGRVRAA